MRAAGRSVLIASLGVFAGGAGAEAAAKSSLGHGDQDRVAVVASLQAFLDGLGHRDKAAMLGQIVPGGGVTLMRDGKPLQMTLETLVDKLSQPGKERREERLFEPLVRIDHDVAIVWARFEFRIDGKLDHCGRDVANMVKVDGRWLIASIQDNGRKACGPSH